MHQPVITEAHPGATPTPAGEDSSRKVMIGAAVGAVVLLVVVIAAVIFLLQPNTDTARIRDVFIIFMALVSILIGFTLVILIAQMARLLNLLQNEIKPILDSTQETAAHLRGTTVFLSDNLVEPVIKLNEYMAGFSEFAKLVGLARRK
jgi:hypothetical protein